MTPPIPGKTLNPTAAAAAATAAAAAAISAAGATAAIAAAAATRLSSRVQLPSDQSSMNHLVSSLSSRCRNTDQRKEASGTGPTPDRLETASILASLSEIPRLASPGDSRPSPWHGFPPVTMDAQPGNPVMPPPPPPRHGTTSLFWSGARVLGEVGVRDVCLPDLPFSTASGGGIPARTEGNGETEIIPEGRKEETHSNAPSTGSSLTTTGSHGPWAILDGQFPYDSGTDFDWLQHEGHKTPERLWAEAALPPPPKPVGMSFDLLDARGTPVAPPGLTEDEEYEYYVEVTRYKKEAQETRAQELIRESREGDPMKIHARHLWARRLPKEAVAFEKALHSAAISDEMRTRMRLSRPVNYTSGLRPLRLKYTALGLRRLRRAYLRRWAGTEPGTLRDCLQQMSRMAAALKRGGTAAPADHLQEIQDGWALDQFWNNVRTPVIDLTDYGGTIAVHGVASPQPPPMGPPIPPIVQ